MEEELVKMSAKGQLVVPNSIRKAQELSPRDRFIAVPISKGVLFKKIQIPSSEKNFFSLLKDIEKHFKRKGIKPEDIQEAVRWARRR